MKVFIGPHLNWVGPYQLAEKIFFWKDKYQDPIVYRFGSWLATDRYGKDSWLAKLCQRIHDNRARKLSVKIHSYDAWNADHTLSLIILPILQELKISKQGAGFVDDSDVPIELHSTLYPGENEWDTDLNHFKRWDWILDEMIWAFTEIAHGNDDAFFKHPPSSECADLEETITKIQVDEVGLQKYNARINNGTRLFGKYYRSLWD